jgi:hypothetical protein
VDNFVDKRENGGGNITVMHSIVQTGDLARRMRRMKMDTTIHETKLKILTVQIEKRETVFNKD